MIRPYKSSLEHLLEELKILDIIIGYRIVTLRATSNRFKDWNQYSGFYVSNEEVNSILESEEKENQQNKNNNLGNHQQPNQVEILQLIDNMKSAIEERKTETLKSKTPIHLYLERFEKHFSLSQFEKQTVLFCLAPEIDSKYEKLYAYIQNDVTKKKPTVGLILDLLSSTADVEERISDRKKYFSSYSTLVHSKILELEEPRDNEPYLISKPLKLNRLVVDFLLGQQENDFNDDKEIDPLGFSLFIPKKGNIDYQFYYYYYYELYGDLKQRIISYIRNYEKETDVSSYNNYDNKFLVFYLQGIHGIGKKTIIKSICIDLNIPLITVDLSDIIRNISLVMSSTSTQQAVYDEIVDNLFLKSRLMASALYIDHFDLLQINENDDNNTNKIKAALKSKLLYKIKNFYGLIFFAGEKSWYRELQSSLSNLSPIVIEFQELTYSMRKAIWERYTKDCFFQDPDIINFVSNDFVFTTQQIVEAVKTMKSFVVGKEEDSKYLFKKEDLYKACRFQSGQILSNFCNKIDSKYKWDDLVLPKNIKEKLRDILNYVKFKNLVLVDWGFDRKLSLGKGLNILFEGESGTGKTMAAEVLANELKLDLYKIDISSVVSKYIGETEKNLNSIFKQSETSNSILCIDEADSLFGKRTEIREAHDKYANIETNYLLQKLEEHTGIVILATNLPQNIDDAFTRRINYSVEFPFPTQEYRMKIWERMFPATASINKEDIDLFFLSKQFNITGGTIKNVVIKAAFRAAAQSTKISMSHIILALKDEYEKIGKPRLKSDFGQYFTLFNEEQNTLIT